MRQLISPENEARITDCRAAYGSWLRSERAIALLVCLGIMMLGVAAVYGDDPSPGATGACCLGGGVCYEVQDESACVAAGGLFVPGGECETEGVSPCDRLPGGYD